DVVRQAVSFARGPVGCEREDRALSHEMRGGVVLVQVSEDGSERLARVEFLGGRRIFGIHEHHEVRVWGKERHLAFRIATVGAVCVGFDELTDRQAVGGFIWGDGDMFAHGLISLRAYVSNASAIPGTISAWCAK